MQLFASLNSTHIALAALSLLSLAVVPACQKANVGAASSTVTVATAETTRPQETWDVFYIKGSKVGFVHTKISDTREAGQPMVRIESDMVWSLSRFGQKTDQQSRNVSVETPDGEVVRFESETLLSQTPAKTIGQVVGDEMLIQNIGQGQQQITKLPWSSDIKGFNALEQSLLAKPLRAGERRKFKSLLPIFNQVVETELVAHDIEATRFPSGSKELLRIESIMTLASGQPVASTLWTDARGDVLKTRIDTLQQEIFRATREEALAPTTGPSFDLGNNSIVKLARPLAGAHQTRRVRYLVELTDGNPADVFAAGGAQTIKPLGPRKAEITVVQQRPGQSISGEAAADQRPPGEDDLAPNDLVQSDDPAVVAMAREAAGQVKDSVVLAMALEKYVHRTMTRTNYSQAFASAAEVARSHEGDCTEHAVLLAALARACGIPARVAIGLVYVARDGRSFDADGFAFHMWTEVYVDGRWTALDATRAEGGIGAAHLKLTDSNLKGASAYSSFLPVFQVLGKLKIEVLEAE